MLDTKFNRPFFPLLNRCRFGAGMLSVVAMLAIAGPTYAQMTQAESFEQGGLAGSPATRQALFDSLNAAKGADVIKNYDPAARPAGAVAYDGNVLGAITSSGSAKIGNCGAGVAGGADQASVQHCEAVNAVNHQANMPPQNVIPPNDPLLNKAKAIRTNPEALAGSFVTSYTGCTTTTVTTPGASVVQTCNDYGDLAPQSCQTGTAITLDPDYFYRCLETIQTPVSSTCTYGRVIRIDTDTNYLCRSTVQTTKSSTCRKSTVVTVGSAHELAKAQQLCGNWSGWAEPGERVDCTTERYGLSQTIEATSYLDNGYNQLWIDGAYQGTYTEWQRQNCWITTDKRSFQCNTSATVGNGGGNRVNARGVITVWYNGGGYVNPGSDTCAPSRLNRRGRAQSMSLCKSACNSYTREWVCHEGADCRWFYTCANNGGANTCPAGWIDRGSSCREPLYDQLVAQGCFLAPAQTATVGHDTIYRFYCLQVSDECAAYNR